MVCGRYHGGGWRAERELGMAAPDPPDPGGSIDWRRGGGGGQAFAAALEEADV